MDGSLSRAATATLLKAFLAFWLFLAVDKFALTLHYSLLSPLGERLLPLWIVGLLIGGESFLQMLLDVPAGRIVDRFGRRRMLFVGLAALSAAALLLMDFTLPTFIASIACSVLGWLFLAPGTNAYLLSYAQRETSGRFLALRDTFWSVGVVLASVSLPFILLYTPLVMGAVILILAFFSLFLLLASPHDKPVLHGTRTLPAEPYHVRRTAFLKSLRAIRRLNPASGMLCIYSFVAAIFYGAIWFVVPLAIASDPHQQLLGLGLGIFDLSIVVLGVVIGTLVDRGNKRLLVFYGLLLFAVMGLLLGLTLGPLFLLFGFLATAGDETTGLSLWSWLHSLDKEHAHDGAVAGVISFSEDFGYAIGPVLAGFTYGGFGPGWAIAFAALPLVLVWLSYSVFIRPAWAELPLLDIPRMPRRRRHKS
ncbi:MAG: MFS transporter [Patescibacteria group bacterium]|nr:MFS transporter [Patescibacteria group bacterium]MDE1965699.1 MFS transporter [Patescibacteria group bacterium]